MQLFRRHSLPSIRSKLFTLVLACALPILAGYFAFARDAAHREREHIEHDARTVAQALVAAVDRGLASGETAARVLANSPLLANDALKAFHAADAQLYAAKAAGRNCYWVEEETGSELATVESQVFL